MKKKAKILFVITKSSFGGAQKYVYDLATDLSKNNFDVVVATGGSGSFIQKLKEENIRIVSIPSLVRDINIGSDLKSFFELYSIFKKEKPDVVHLNSAKASGIGAFVARLACVPNIIFTAHGWAFNEERSFLQKMAIKFFSWLTVVLSHKTITVSDFDLQNTKHWPFIATKILTIHNGVTNQSVSPKEELRQKLSITQQIPENAVLIGTIAELHKNKGLRYSIEAVSKLILKNKKLYYVIIGEGEEREYLQNLIKKQRVADRIFLLGFKEDAHKFISAFDIFVLPSTKEGLPYVLLEAGLAPLPVVATNIGGIPEIIKDNETGLLVPPKDIGGLYSAINKLISKPKEAKNMSDKLKQQVLKNFSLEQMFQKTKALYRK